MFKVFNQFKSLYIVINNIFIYLGSFSQCHVKVIVCFLLEVDMMLNCVGYFTNDKSWNHTIQWEFWPFRLTYNLT